VGGAADLYKSTICAFTEYFHFINNLRADLWEFWVDGGSLVALRSNNLVVTRGHMAVQ